MNWIEAALYRIREALTCEDGPRVSDAVLMVDAAMQQLQPAHHTEEKSVGDDI